MIGIIFLWMGDSSATGLDWIGLTGGYWFRHYSEDCSQAQTFLKLDPVGSTVRYEMMKLCTGSV